jgi:hypothetical protein
MTEDVMDKPLPPGVWQIWRAALAERDDATMLEIECWVNDQLGGAARTPQTIYVNVNPVPPGRPCGPPGYPSWTAWLTDEVSGWGTTGPARRKTAEELSLESDRRAGMAAWERLRQSDRSSVPSPHFNIEGARV